MGKKFLVVFAIFDNLMQQKKVLKQYQMSFIMIELERNIIFIYFKYFPVRFLLLLKNRQRALFQQILSNFQRNKFIYIIKILKSYKNELEVVQGVVNIIFNKCWTIHDYHGCAVSVVQTAKLGSARIYSHYYIVRFIQV